MTGPPGDEPQLEELSELISVVYDAALDASRWGSALEKTAAFIGTATASIVSSDSQRPAIDFAVSWGDDPAYTALFLERYTQFSPMNFVGHELAVGEVCAFSSYVSLDEFRATEFYQQWVRPQGYIDAAQVILEKSGSAMAVLSGVRREAVGLADERMASRMRIVAPHFRRAVLIGKIIDLKTIEAATFAETIEGLAAGVFLVDGDRHILHANQNGQLLLADGSIVQRDGRRLRLMDSAANASLHQAVGTASRSEAELASRGTGVPVIGPDGNNYMVRVLPLTSGNRRVAGIAHAATAAIFVRRAELDLAVPIAAMARRYGLTQAETKVLRALLEQAGMPSIAAAVGTSTSTVKTHLLHMFEKTDTGTQADLVRLTLGFADPLAPAGPGDAG